jgi:late competence protein required for DNA uptake (superfamily II DNA/RNA helicase)
MECQRCKSVLKEGETYNLSGKLMCEDCYIYETNPPRACDPMAVSSALSIRKQLGQSGSAGLSELQEMIYRVIEEYGKITKDELILG